jgi:hypothetical protein
MEAQKINLTTEEMLSISKLNKNQKTIDPCDMFLPAGILAPVFE